MCRFNLLSSKVLLLLGRYNLMTPDFMIKYKKKKNEKKDFRNFINEMY